MGIRGEGKAEWGRGAGAVDAPNEEWEGIKGEWSL